MTRIATAELPHSAERCWRVFTDVAMLPSWVPGLQRARIVTRNAEGLPSEVTFEYGNKLSYSLVYSYDAQREVRWQPRVGRKDGVSGRATFEPKGEGCRFSYALDPASPHAAPERTSEDPERIVAAFSAWLSQGVR